MKPTDPPAGKPSAGDGEPPERASTKRPGGHGSYKIGGEPAVGHRWNEAPPPPPATLSRFDDGVPHRHHEPGEEDPLHNEDVAHEHIDVDLRAVGMSAVILVVVAVAAMALMIGLFKVFESTAAANDPRLSPLAPGATQMPTTTTASPFFNTGVENAPRLLTNEPMALQKHHADEAERLRNYGWVNEQAGRAHVPIDEAKKLLLGRGLPVREGAAPLDFGVRPWVRGESSGGRAITQPLPERTDQGPAPSPAAKPHGSGH